VITNGNQTITTAALNKMAAAYGKM